MSLPDADLARRFDSEVVARYGRLFVELAGGARPKGKEPQRVLDFACATGFAALGLIDVLPKGSRLVCLDEDRFLLKAFHARLTSELRQHVFVRKEDRRRLPFASGVFDWAYGLLPLVQPDNMRQILRQALRVVRPGGTLTLCVPLENSFIELTSLAIAAGKTAGQTNLEALLADRQPLQSREAWEKQLLRIGGTEVRSTLTELTIPVQQPLGDDPLFADHLAPLWLGAPLEEAPGVAAALAQQQGGTLTVSARIGCIQCTRGFAELEETTGG